MRSRPVFPGTAVLLLSRAAVNRQEGFHKGLVITKGILSNSWLLLLQLLLLCGDSNRAHSWCEASLAVESVELIEISLGVSGRLRGIDPLVETGRM